jgi:hypothetical protein
VCGVDSCGLGYVRWRALVSKMMNIEHFIKSADVQFTVYSAGHSTPSSSSPDTVYVISIRLMLHFLFLIILYLNLYTTVLHYI